MTEIEKVLAKAELLYSESEINAALDKIAVAVTRDYQDKNPVMLCVMNGAVMTAGHLLPKLPFPLELDYIHASRYGDKTVGGDLIWQSQPTINLLDRHVILIEDIFDEGITLAALRDFCHEAGARSVACACLLDKEREGKHGPLPEYIGMTVPDRYVFGFGMDAAGYWRNLPSIYMMREGEDKA